MMEQNKLLIEYPMEKQRTVVDCPFCDYKRHRPKKSDGKLELVCHSDFK